MNIKSTKNPHLCRSAHLPLDAGHGRRISDDCMPAPVDQNAQRLPTHVVEVDGLVADVSGNSITVNVGSKAGVKVGDHLALSRKVRDIKDPATGKVSLVRDDTIMGKLTETDEGKKVIFGGKRGSVLWTFHENAIREKNSHAIR